MRHTTTATLLAAACLTLAGCGGSSDDKPAPTATVTKTTAPAKAAADPWEECVRAVADSTEASPYPAECQKLSTDDYYRAVSEANRRNIEKARKEIDEASASAAAQ